MKKSQKKNKIQRELQSINHGAEMPTADEVAAERACEAAYEHELAVLMLEEACKCGEYSDTGGSDDEMRLRSELRPLQLVQTTARARPPPTAAAVLRPVAAALRDAHPHDIRFIDEYILLLAERSEAEIQAITEELMRSVEGTLSAGAGGSGGAVLASWLGSATAWRSPRVPGVLPALHCLLQHLTSHQVSEVAHALHAALGPQELVAASDAVRGVRARARGHGLAALLLRATLAKLLGREPRWRDGAPNAAELRATLAKHWGKLGVSDQLAGIALVGRVLTGGERREAGELLAVLAPPPPKDIHDPDYLKVSVAVKTLQNLFKDM